MENAKEKLAVGYRGIVNYMSTVSYSADFLRANFAVENRCRLQRRLIENMNNLEKIF
jgi:hypothetical protein